MGRDGAALAAADAEQADRAARIDGPDWKKTLIAEGGFQGGVSGELVDINGNGRLDIVMGGVGNNGPHQLDLVRWALGNDRLPSRVLSFGGRYGYIDDGQVPKTLISVYDYEGIPLVYECRGLPRAKGAEFMDDFVGVAAMKLHLTANGVDLNESQIVVGPELEMDSAKECFVGSHSERANLMLQDTYREPFVIRDAGLLS